LSPPDIPVWRMAGSPRGLESSPHSSTFAKSLLEPRAHTSSRLHPPPPIPSDLPAIPPIAGLRPRGETLLFAEVRAQPRYPLDGGEVVVGPQCRCSKARSEMNRPQDRKRPSKPPAHLPAGGSRGNIHPCAFPPRNNLNRWLVGPSRHRQQPSNLSS
jgi:hypothetical protein